MTTDDEKELLDSLSNIAESLAYLNRAIKTIVAKNWGLNLPDPMPPRRRP
jgi:hypothetical protein